MTRADSRLARAALSRIMEPSDLHGLAVIRVLGPWESMRIISGNAQLLSAQEVNRSGVSGGFLRR
ncbi:hypothetical protein [Renibacterium salmoninarum]|uniref:hypothetical protein n=1 Tax=Renibacterium salmoninarum TaxID=1646 RepID=UPI0002D3D0B5|nr:hypothetical protein [Renibacterium salmoninarum]